MQDNEVKVGVNCEVKLTSEVHKKDGTSADVYIMRTDSAGKSTTELHHETLKVENQKVVLNWKVEESKLLTGKVEKMELEGACEKIHQCEGCNSAGTRIGCGNYRDKCVRCDTKKKKKCAEALFEQEKSKLDIEEPSAKCCINVECVDRDSSSILKFTYPLNISLIDQKGAPVDNVKVTTYFSDNSKSTNAKFNKDKGTYTIDDAPLGRMFKIELENFHFVGDRFKVFGTPAYGKVGGATTFTGKVHSFTDKDITAEKVLSIARTFFGYPYGQVKGPQDRAKEGRDEGARVYANYVVQKAQEDNEAKFKKKKIEERKKCRDEISKLYDDKDKIEKNIEQIKNEDAEMNNINQMTDEKKKSSAEKQLKKRIAAREKKAEKDLPKLKNTKQDLQTLDRIKNENLQSINTSTAMKHKCVKIKECMKSKEGVDVKDESCNIAVEQKKESIDSEKLRKEKEDFFKAALTELQTLKVKNKDEARKKLEIDCLERFGLVCDTFIEIVMNEAGFDDFPLANEAPPRIDGCYQDGWFVKMKSWIKMHGGDVFNQEDLFNKGVEPADGDLMAFVRPNGNASHINMIMKLPTGDFALIGTHQKWIHSSQGGGEVSNYLQLTPEYVANSLKQPGRTVCVLRPPYSAKKADNTKAESL